MNEEDSLEYLKTSIKNSMQLSDTKDELLECLRQIIFENDVDLTSFNTLYQKVDKAMEEGSKENWDGYQALPIKEEVGEFAKHFSQFLNPDIPWCVAPCCSGDIVIDHYWTNEDGDTEYIDINIGSIKSVLKIDPSPDSPSVFGFKVKYSKQKKDM